MPRMLSAAVFQACHGHHADGVEVASGAFCREAKKCLFVVYNYIIRWFFRTFALCISIIKNTDINIGTQKNIQRYNEGPVLALAWRTDTLLDVS